MTKVNQTENSIGRGNCVAASIASILNMKQDELNKIDFTNDIWKEIVKSTNGFIIKI